jgi:hypothetical protein
MTMRFENPTNGYVEEVSCAPLWSLLAGCFYFAAKGVWAHAVAGGLLAIVTGGLSWFIYPFFATQIMRTNYLRRGWRDVSALPPTSTASYPSPLTSASPRTDRVQQSASVSSVASPWIGEVRQWGIVLGVFVASVGFFSIMMNPPRVKEPQPEAGKAESGTVAQAPEPALAERQRCRPKTAEERSAYLELKKRRAEGTLTGSERVAADIALYNFEIDLRSC